MSPRKKKPLTFPESYTVLYQKQNEEGYWRKHEETITLFLRPTDAEKVSHEHAANAIRFKYPGAEVLMVSYQ